jgi:hypothetical protein
VAAALRFNGQSCAWRPYVLSSYLCFYAAAPLNSPLHTMRLHAAAAVRTCSPLLLLQVPLL